jgi:hypothetical protein
MKKQKKRDSNIWSFQKLIFSVNARINLENNYQKIMKPDFVYQPNGYVDSAILFRRVKEERKIIEGGDLSLRY